MSFWCSWTQRHGELPDDGFVELAAGGVVDGLDAGLRQFELRLAQSADQALALAGRPLGLDEEREALVKGETAHVGVLILFGPRLGHGVQAEGAELVDRGFAEHVDSLSLVVAPATQMFMDGGEGERRHRLDQRHAIEAVFEHGVDVAVGAGPHRARACTGLLEARIAVALGEPQDAEARAVARLGCGWSARMALTRAAVCGPIVRPQAMRRKGLHTKCC
jgi:hypothetical protein